MCTSKNVELPVTSYIQRRKGNSNNKFAFCFRFLHSVIQRVCFDFFMKALTLLTIKVQSKEEDLNKYEFYYLFLDGVIGILHWHISSDRTMALRLTQLLTEMSTRNISWG
jgi:hypothetical protein